jgi:hypothetical protein
MLALCPSLKLPIKSVGKVLDVQDCHILPPEFLHYGGPERSRLTAAESDRTVRLARVCAKAVEMIGDEEKAVAWLRTPNRAFAGERPLDQLDTQVGGSRGWPVTSGSPPLCASSRRRDVNACLSALSADRALRQHPFTIQLSGKAAPPIMRSSCSRASSKAGSEPTTLIGAPHNSERGPRQSLNLLLRTRISRGNARLV